MLALTLIRLCAREINDVHFARVALDAASAVVQTGAIGQNWLDLLNDAQRAVVLVRPDAGSSVENQVLVAGSKQTLAAGTLRILGVTRNMGANGTTPGKVITLASRDDVDAINEDWHSATQATPVDQVIYDDKKAPTVFFVDPPSPGTWYIELELSKTPTDVTNPTAGNITIADIYAGPMQAWMLHRCYAMATQSVGHFQRAQFYFQSFFQQLGVKLKAEMFGGAESQHTLPSTGGVSG